MKPLNLTTEQNVVYIRASVIFSSYKLKQDAEVLQKEFAEPKDYYETSDILKRALIRQEVLVAHQLGKKDRALKRVLETLLLASKEAFDKHRVN